MATPVIDSNEAGHTMLNVAKKKRATVPVYMRLPKDLKKALEDFAEENHRTMAAETEIAIEKHLKAAGRWPVIKNGKADDS